MPINTGSRKPVQLEAVEDWIKTGRVGGLDTSRDRLFPQLH